MKKNRNWLNAVVFLFAIGTAQAQDSPKDLEKTVTDFAKAYAGLGTSKNVDGVLAFMDPDMTSFLVSTAVNGKTAAFQTGMEGFSAHLRQVAVTPGMKINYDLKGFLQSEVNDATGTVVYKVDYEQLRDGETWAKGHETVSMFLVKSPNGWKISHFTVIGVESEKFKGACLCELYTGSGGSLIAKTTMPQGKGYTTDNVQFAFPVTESGRAIMGNEAIYPWLSNGELWTQDDKGEKKKMLGATTKKNEAIMLIIKDKYSENCIGFKVKS